jgi:hypothetical protein
MNEQDAYRFPDPADLPVGPLISVSPRLVVQGRRRGWRWPLVLSVLGHVVVAGLFWLFADKLVRMPDIVSFAPDAEVGTGEAEEEQDYLVMDVGLPAPRPAQVPVVERPAPVVQAARLHDREPPVQAYGGHEVRAGEPPALRTDVSHSPVADGHGAPQNPPVADAPGSPGPAPGSPLFVPTQARSVVYVIDRSGSMGAGGRLALARRELLASLDRLPPGARFQVIPYNRFAEPLRLGGQTVLVPATAENKQQAALLLEALVPEGGTDHLAALQRALLLQPEAIYFLTDADDLEAAQVQLLTRLNRDHAIIHTIELSARHRDRPGMPLQALAHDNRGEYRGVDVGDR